MTQVEMGRGGHEADGTCRTSNSGQSFLAARCNPKAREFDAFDNSCTSEGSDGSSGRPTEHQHAVAGALSQILCPRAGFLYAGQSTSESSIFFPVAEKSARVRLGSESTLLMVPAMWATVPVT